MTDERPLETDGAEPLTEEELQIEAVQLPDREAMSIIAPSGVAGPQALAPLDLLPTAGTDAVPDPGMDS